MTTKIQMIILSVIGLFTFAGCQKDIDGYEQDPRVYFFERANDLNSTRISSKSYTFLTIDSEQLADTVYIKVKTMGELSDVDRYTIGETIEEGTTAVEGVDYEFIPGLVPQGSVEGQIAVVLKRTARLKEETVVLNMTIGESDDFKGGVVEDDMFTISWSDRLVKPDTWPYYFGTYSNVKYQFVIDVLGVADFPAQLSARLEKQPDEYSIADLMDMANVLRVKLRELNEANAGDPNYPLKDENGELVSF